MAEYKRVMLKLSGEMFQGDRDSGIDFSALAETARRIKEFKLANKLQLAIVVGAGNIWRYRDSDGSGIDRVTADKMGMLATVMNGVALAKALENSGVPAICLSGFSAASLCDDYDVELARDYLDEDIVLICAGGTTNPYFTTDSAAVLRALELECDVLLKGTKVDGVYSADPEKDANAVRYNQLAYQEAIEQNLQVMDLTAIALAKDNKLPMLVFAFEDDNALMNIINDKSLGTLVS